MVLVSMCKVVVGARSAVFAPLDNIGAIIIDEEHEATYKQESNPRYHARDVAFLGLRVMEPCLSLGQQHHLLRHGRELRKGFTIFLS